MKPTITRKDFMNGVALAAGGALLRPLDLLADSAGPDPTAREYLLAQGIDQSDPRYYPPGLAGMRGSHPGSFEVAHALGDGKRWDTAAASDTGETYNLVVVGGGISGLAAAYFFRKTHGPGAKILVLDNHDDFGGHAKRNEFRSGSLLGYGGTQEIEGWPNWSPQAKSLLHELGIEPERFEQNYYQHDFRRSHGLKHAVFFDREAFGSDAMVNDVGLPTWAAFAHRTPLQPRAQADLVRFQTQRIDYLPGLAPEDKKARLLKISFAAFLKDYVKADDQVIAYFRNFVTGYAGIQIDAIPAWLALQSGPFLETYWEGQQGPTRAALEGMGLGSADDLPREKPGFGCYHFPDGNASIARMIVRSLIPTSAPGSTMGDIVTAHMDYSRLDSNESNVRIRLNSTAVDVQHVGEPTHAKEIQVTYVRDGKADKVRGGACVLACYNMIIPRLCPQLPQPQKTALAMGEKTPLVYANAQLRRWTSLQKLGVAMMYCPGSYFSEVYMDFPVSMGTYHYTRSPDDPVVLHMVRVPCSPGLPARQQRRMGRMELYTTPFETFERNIREQLTRMLGPGGFDPQGDLEAITVNRWPHGYADFFADMDDPDWPQDQRPNVVGRQPFGRISIANSDAAASAQTQAAIDEAYRAVQEITKAHAGA